MRRLLASFLFVTVACGGSASAALSTDDYVTAMNDAFFAYDRQLRTALSLAETATPGALDAGVRAMADQTNLYAESVAALQPPEALAAQHGRYLEGVEAIAAVLADAAERFASPEEFGDADSDAFELRIADEGTELSRACRELTLAALDAGSDLRLECNRWG